MDKIPKVKVYNGIAFPGPSHFVKRFAGISKTIYLEGREGDQNMEDCRVVDDSQGADTHDT
jgi:hypothetical protein